QLFLVEPVGKLRILAHVFLQPFLTRELAVQHALGFRAAIWSVWQRERFMVAATVGTARLTFDPVAPEHLESDIARLFDTLGASVMGLVPMDVAYAVIATTPSGIRRIFEVKRQYYEKPSGMFGNWRMSRDIHLMDDSRHAMVREIMEQEKIP